MGGGARRITTQIQEAECGYNNSDQPTLRRLADWTGEEWHRFTKNNATTRSSSYSYIYLGDQVIKPNAIGVCQWYTVPNSFDPTKVYVRATLCDSPTPIRFVFCPDIADYNDLITSLLNGRSIDNAYLCDTAFCFMTSSGGYEGVVCPASKLIVDDKVTLSPTSYLLEKISCSNDDLMYLNEGLIFFKHSTDGLISGKQATAGPNVIIARLFEEYFTWNKYKSLTGDTKNTHAELKNAIARVIDSSTDKDQTFIQNISRTFDCTIQEAKQLLSDFNLHCANFLDLESSRIEELAEIALASPTIKAKCEEIAEKQWLTTHHNKISSATNELNNINEKTNRAKLENRKLIDELNAIQAEISKQEKVLAAKVAQVERQQELADQALQAINNKFSSKEEGHISAFIAELAPIVAALQGVNTQPASIQMKAESWQLLPAESVAEVIPLSTLDEAQTFCEYNLIDAGVDPAYSRYLAAFLLAAYSTRTSIILAGPNSADIARALSLSVTGATPTILQCFGAPDHQLIDQALQSSFTMITNPFHSGWIDWLPQVSRAFTIWVHPTWEDLALEPTSIWNYALPLNTELFVVDHPQQQINACTWDGSINEEIIALTETITSTTPAKVNASRLLKNKLGKLISICKQLTLSEDATVETLFGTIPFLLLTGRYDELREYLKENGPHLDQQLQIELPILSEDQC